MNSIRRSRRKALLVAAAGAVCAGSSLLMSAPAVAAPSPVVQSPSTSAACSDVELVFARGTGEPQGSSVLQRGTLSALKSGLPGKTVSDYSVVYPASSDQNAKPGQVDLVNRVTSVAQNCPNTKFVLGGYSQGATVVSMSVGVSLYGRAPDGALPASLAPKVAAIVTFGSPLGNKRLAAAAPTYADRILEFCADGDPVCRNGSSFTAHLAYMSNGDTTKAGQFAAQKVLASAPTPGNPTPDPAPVPVPDPGTTPTPPTLPEPPATRPWWCSFVPFLCSALRS